jgi:hypothetical protein
MHNNRINSDWQFRCAPSQPVSLSVKRPRRQTVYVESDGEQRMKDKLKVPTHDDYSAWLLADKRAVLEKLRRTIRVAAPGVE